MPPHPLYKRFARPLGVLAVFAVVAAPLTATPSALPGVAPLTAYANATDVDQHETQGHRPPSGPVVPTPPDDGALLTAAPAAIDSTWVPVSHSVEELAPGVSFSRDRSYDAGGFVDSWLLTTDLKGPTKPKLLAESVSGAMPPTELADADGCPYRNSANHRTGRLDERRRERPSELT